MVIIVASLGLVWAFSEVISFFQMRARTTSTTTGLVVGYEFAGGKERLRVQVRPKGKPNYFMLVNATTSPPRYAEGQIVALLSWPETNSLGQTLLETTAYAARNFWLRPALVAVCSLLALAVSVARLARYRRDRPTAH